MLHMGVSHQGPSSSKPLERDEYAGPGLSYDTCKQSLREFHEGVEEAETKRQVLDQEIGTRPRDRY